MTSEQGNYAMDSHESEVEQDWFSGPSTEREAYLADVAATDAEDDAAYYAQAARTARTTADRAKALEAGRWNQEAGQ